MHPTRILVLTSVLALPLVAQDAAATAAQGPILVLKSADLGPVMGLAMALGVMDPPPELGDGEHFVLSMGADRKPTVTTARGAVRYAELTADPAGLMRAFDKEIQEARGMAQGLAVMAMSQQGIEPAAAMQMMQTVFEFPQQLERATVVLNGNPEDIAETGLDLEVGLTGKAGTFAAQLLQAMRPNPQGAPVLAGEGGVMNMALSLDPKSLPALLTPFLDFGLSFSYPDPETRKAARGVWDKMMGMYDGSIAFAIGEGMSMNGVYGFQKADALAALLESDEYVEMMKSQQPSRDIEVEVTPDAFEHRGAKFTKLLVINNGMPNPMMPNDEMTTYSGAVGSYMVMAGTEAKAKALADAVADGKIARRPLPGGAVMTLDMDLGAMMASMGDAMPMGELPPDAPRRMSMGVTAKDRTVTISIRAK